MPNPQSGFDQLIVTTFRNVRALMADNLSLHNPVLAEIRAAGGVRTETGGHQIQENLLYEENSTVQSYTGFEVLDTAPQEGLTSALYEWKQVAGTASISGEQLFKNSGKSQIVSLLETKIKQLDLSFRNRIAAMLLSNGTGNGGKDIPGLDLFVQDGTGGTWSTVGNINSTTHTFWRNQFFDFDDFGAGDVFSTVATGHVSTNGVRMLRRITRLCTRNTDRPNLYLTSGPVWEAYLGVAEGQKGRIILGPGTKRMIDLGFPTAEFMGQPLVYDVNVVEDDLFALNTQYLHFVIGEGKEFVMSPFVEPVAQDARVAKMFLYATMTCSNRSLQGRVIEIDPD